MNWVVIPAWLMNEPDCVESQFNNKLGSYGSFS